MLALTHVVTPALADCELTFVDRQPIDVDAARRQHRAYCDTLTRLGVEVRTVATSASPDAAFVEDVAIVLDETAIATSMGAESRRAEVEAFRAVLAEYRGVEAVELPATIEGGDVLRVGRRLFVGRSSRTNREGIDALRRLAAPHGYEVVAVDMRDCLHLKTGCTALTDSVLLANSAWVDTRAFAGIDVLEVADPFGANTLRLGDTICISAAHRATAEMLASEGFEVVTVDISEFEKAEAGVTCLSILLDAAVG